MLGLGATRTMRLAQELYEGVDLGGETVGLITYMRTDGVQIAREAIAAARRLIARNFGEAYLPEQPRRYSAKARNAQEAHEAIRPTDLFRRPQDLGDGSVWRHPEHVVAIPSRHVDVAGGVRLERRRLSSRGRKRRARVRGSVDAPPAVG